MPARGLVLGGRYRIEETIGEGGMGVVCRAYDRQLDSSVAVKTIKGRVDRSSLVQFQKESETLKKLFSPNIVSIFDRGEYEDEEGKKPYFVMPLLPGASLDKVLKTASASGLGLEPERVVRLIREACKGLHAAHKSNIIHRDLKPSNLFVLEDDSVMIIDFGIVHLTGTNSDTSLKGTWHYMAPEQFGGKPSQRSDIFSLGVVCYEALTGTKPFDGETPAQVMHAIQSHIPEPITKLNSSVSHLLAQVVHRALAKDPEFRLSSAREFSDFLDRALRNEPIPPLDPAKITPRLGRIRQALRDGDHQHAREMLHELEIEGWIAPDIPFLRKEIADGARAREIHQLLEIAQALKEEGDYLRALEKVQAVLDLDRDNVDANALKREIERLIRQAGIDQRYQMARQQFDRKSYRKAIDILKELLSIDRGYRPAEELLAEATRRDAEQARLRQEMQRLFSLAQKAKNNNEFSNAAAKMERVLQIEKQLSEDSQKNAEFELVYREIVQKRDELRGFCADAKQALEAGDFIRAREICSEALNRCPGYGPVETLLIQVDEKERQAQFARIEQWRRHIEAELDLDKRYGLAEKAMQEFPDESVFRQALRQVNETRRTVQRFIRRAHEYESQRQFREARDQWELVVEAYPSYPGAGDELERLSRSDAQEQVRAEWLDNVQRALSFEDYERAHEVVNLALTEFPDDADLLRLNREVAILKEGDRLESSGKRREAIEWLRAARVELPNSEQIGRALSGVLIALAREMESRDPQAARELRAEAARLDPESSLEAGLSKQEREPSPPDDNPIPQEEPIHTDVQSRWDPSVAPSVFAPSPGAQRANDSQAANGTPSKSASTPEREDRRNKELDKIESGLGRRTWYLAVAAVAALALAVVWFQQGHRKTSNPAPVPTAEISAVAAHDSKTPPPADDPHGAAHSTDLPSSAAKSTEPPPSTTKPTEPGFGTKLVERTPAPKSTEPEKPKADAQANSWLFTVRFRTDPEAAEVNVDDDDRLTCLTPCELKLPRGEHTIFITGENRPMVQRNIVLPGDENLFMPLPNELKVVYVNSAAHLNVAVDGEDQGPAPLTLHLKPGDHRLTITGNGVRYEETFRVSKQEDGGPQTIDIDQKAGVKAATTQSDAPGSAPPQGGGAQ